MRDILALSAWRMTKPEPFGVFHITLLLLGCVLCVFLAYRFRYVSHRSYTRTLSILAAVLILLEVYKQLFHYYILHNGQYDWWIFPFQLCSLPMYLCLFFPILPQRLRTPIETFLMDFSFLGAFLALLYPMDLVHSYVTLTMHAFLWHFLLLFISLFIGFTHHGDTSVRGFLQTLPLFFLFVGIATAVNVMFHSYGEINMFYISPYYESIQPLFRFITPIVGLHIRNIVYLLAMITGACFLHYLWNRVQTIIK